VDIIIDRDKGPMVVELNARPGLGIQLANETGLKERLSRVENLKNITTERAVRLSKDLFGGEIDEEIENISGREVIGLFEEITLFGKNEKEIKVKCKVDTGAESSSIDRKIAIDLGYEEVIDFFEKIKKENIGLDLMDEYDAGKFDHPEILSVDRVKSATGVDFRIKIELKAQLKERRFKIKINIADRSNLSYPMLLGKRDLGEFLIDVTRI